MVEKTAKITKEKTKTTTKSKAKKTKTTKPKKKVEEVELYSSYDTQKMFNDLNKLMELCRKLGHTNIMLNIILTKGRLANIYDPLQAIQKAKIVEDDKQINIQLVEYKNDTI